MHIKDAIRDVATAFLHDDFSQFVQLAEQFAQVDKSTCESDYPDHVSADRNGCSAQASIRQSEMHVHIN